MDTLFKHCSVTNCNHNAHYKHGGALGMCCAHYRKYKKYGNPLTVAPKKKSICLDWIVNNKYYDKDTCLIWPFSRNKAGYGDMCYEGRTRLAHRVMCLIAHGNPPLEGMDAAHSCGNGTKGCINPKHLRWDTRKGNFADKLKHGTDNRGEKSPVSKLSQIDVEEIISMKGRVSQLSLSKKFRVDPSNISKIQCGKSWVYK